MFELFYKTFDTVKPAVAILAAIMTWLMFPEQSYVAWCIAVWSAAGLDLLTRWLAIFVKSRGIKKAFITKAWNSEAMFHKTGIKIVSYFVIMILAGLSMRFVSVPYISNIVATAVYAFLFFREFASNIENLIDAGADYLQPLLFWVKKKESEVLKENDDNNKEGGSDEQGSI